MWCKSVAHLGDELWRHHQSCLLHLSLWPSENEELQLVGSVLLSLTQNCRQQSVIWAVWHLPKTSLSATLLQDWGVNSDYFLQPCKLLKMLATFWPEGLKMSNNFQNTDCLSELNFLLLLCLNFVTYLGKTIMDS